VAAASRPYGEFYDFYSISLEYFVYHLVAVHMVEKEGMPTLFRHEYGILSFLKLLRNSSFSSSSCSVKLKNGDKCLYHTTRSVLSSSDVTIYKLYHLVAGV
jgi:hypothetical protein